MKTSGIISILSLIIFIAALFSALPTIFHEFSFQTYTFENILGREVLIFGSGTYERDSIFTALGFISQDFVVIFLGLPLLILSLWLYVKNLWAGGPALMAVLGFFLYAYLSSSFAASYNRFFILYIIIYSASFFAMFLLAKEVHLPYLLTKRLIKKFPGIYLIVSGFITLIIWGVPLAVAAFNGDVPLPLYHYTTFVTHALDLGIIVPASIVAGILILRGSPTGYKMAFPLLGIIIFLLPVILLSTYLQYSNGIVFTPAEVVGPVSGFLILGLLGLWILGRIIYLIHKSQFTPGQL